MKGYKHTELGWIPEEWEVKFYEEVTKFINGRAYKQEELLTDGKYKVLRVGNFFTNDEWYFSDLELEDDKYVVEGDLMYAWSASFGPRFWSGKKTIYHYHIWKVIPEKSILKDYLYYSFDFDKERIINSKQGGTMFHITKGDMEKRKIPLPCLSEQKIISNILKVWDKSIETFIQLITAKQQLKKGLMQQLLTGKKRLPGFEESWEEVCLADIAQFRNGKGHENDIVDEGKFIVVNSKFISSDAEEFKTTNVCLEPLYTDEIVMVMSDVPKGKALAKCFIIDENNKYTLNQRICAFRATKVNPYFLYYLLNRNPYFLEFDSGVGQTNLRKDDILECPLVLPSQREQVAIVKILMSIDRELKALKWKLIYYKLQKQGLMQQLLTGKKRVKV